MRADQEISKEEYAQRKEILLTEKARLEKAMDKTGTRINAWLENGDRMMSFLEDVTNRFNTGGIQARRNILGTIGSNLILKDKILSIDMEKCLLPLKDVSGEIWSIKKKLEPLNTLEKQKEFEYSCSQNPQLLGDRESNPD